MTEIKTTPAPSTVDCTYETNAVARCPHDEGAVLYDVEIRISPEGETIDGAACYDLWYSFRTSKWYMSRNAQTEKVHVYKV